MTVIYYKYMYSFQLHNLYIVFFVHMKSMGSNCHFKYLIWMVKYCDNVSTSLWLNGVHKASSIQHLDPKWWLVFLHNDKKWDICLLFAWLNSLMYIETNTNYLLIFLQLLQMWEGIYDHKLLGNSNYFVLWPWIEWGACKLL